MVKCCHSSADFPVLFLFSFEWESFAIAVSFLIPPLFEYILGGRKSKDVNPLWLRQIGLIFGTLAFFWAFRPDSSLTPSRFGIYLEQAFFSFFFPLDGCEAEIWKNFWIIIVGIHLSASELNLGIRMILSRLNAEPGSNDTVDQKEYNRGRIIGVLERTLVFILFLTGSASAVGFVITAKGLIRFSELNKRDFAEYFLVGTLLSVTGSLIVSIAVKALMV
ncbi:MAG: hypothetical protein B1H09_00460 [Gemmatimonadaceae bacterium 4484_173]|nr:MAG: hypothetical protein B1H09_00460 [Gemmatimonadaceae bacterium 4484_173]RKZ02010.1 MAG: hypothetical protein DRQ21_09500 [Candidatus Fermentibacteria bacterium]